MDRARRAVVRVDRLGVLVAARVVLAEEPVVALLPAVLDVPDAELPVALGAVGAVLGAAGVAFGVVWAKAGLADAIATARASKEALLRIVMVCSRER
ncbi:MAG: hypothetical protein JO326_14775, partial [Acetobacteraceae bacterium]|nr:hypothetical protein [Acetobacteraceae bacterium]